MDAQHLDRLAMSLAAATSRRGVLAVVLGSLLHLLGRRPVPAGRKQKKRRHQQQTRQKHRRTHDARAKSRTKGNDKAKHKHQKRRTGARAEGPCGNGSAKANACKRDGQCCTGTCDKHKGRCRCKKLGEGCAEDRNCCASFGQPMTCQGGVCQSVAAPLGCTPTTCAAQGATCGPLPDGCGSTLDCGACT